MRNRLCEALFRVISIECGYFEGTLGSFTALQYSIALLTILNECILYENACRLIRIACSALEFCSTFIINYTFYMSTLLGLRAGRQKTQGCDICGRD